MKQSWGWSWVRTSLQPLPAVLANPEQALATGLPQSCPTPAIARPVFCTLSLHKVFALFKILCKSYPSSLSQGSANPSPARSLCSCLWLLLSSCSLLPSGSGFILDSSKNILRPVSWSWEWTDETVGTPSSYRALNWRGQGLILGLLHAPFTLLCLLLKAGGALPASFISPAP